MGKIYDIGITDIRRVALLTDPSVGSTEAIKTAAFARQRFNDSGIDVVGIQGKDESATLEMTKEVLRNDNIDALVVCGDDPLINVALQPQVGSGKPLGIIPAGESSDIARAFNIPTNPKRAADIITRGFYTTTDLGKITNSNGESRWFVSIANSGYDAFINQRSQRFRGKLKSMRAPLAAVASLRHFQASPSTITLDDVETITIDALLCAVGNTKFYGQGMMICPNAGHHDGVFDITVVPDMSRIKASTKFVQLYQVKADQPDFTQSFTARKVRVEHPGQVNGADCRPFASDSFEAEVMESEGLFLVPRP